MSQDVDEHLIQALWGNSGFDFVSKNSNGKSGGIIAVWDKHRFSRTGWEEGDGFIAVFGIWLPINAPCLVIIVYAPQNINLKRLLWNSLNMLISTHDCLTIIMGDFNEVRNASERFGLTFCRKGATIFNEFISSSGLSEIPMGGWSGSPYGSFTKAEIFKKKLQHLKSVIKQWRKTVGLLENTSSASLRDTLDSIDKKAETSTLSCVDIDIRSKTLKFKEDFSWRPSFSSNLFKTLSSEDVSLLDQPFSIQEIKDAIWSCGGEKDPGPDGFTFKLIKKHWNLLGPDIISYVKEFKSSNFIHVGCNSSFTTLVPKTEDPLSINDFRPISLIRCQYKIIAKILTNRLAFVISSVVSDCQMAFIKGRQIINGPLLVDEIIAWAKQKKKKMFILKVDFEKAFDTLNWSFLDSIMAQMGFSTKWRGRINACLNSVFASILVNGSPTKEFKLEKGLRQGDPLSPLLFILAVEALNVAILEAKDKKLFSGFEVGKDKINVCHLQFTDDAIILGNWSLVNVKNMSRILTCFHLASGLKVNFNKSKLFGIGVSNYDLNSVGLPIGSNMSKCSNWQPLIDRFYKRLSSWKAKSLSFGGRLTLTKAVLGSLGVYFFSTFKAPKSIISKLESIRRRFFWGGSSDNKKISWIAWSKTTAPLCQGGLDIGSLRVSNLSMLAKWWWRFLSEPNHLWCKVIRSIHGAHGGLDEPSYIRSKAGPWFRIAKLKNDLSERGIDLPLMFKKKLGNGEDTRFWLDIWVGNSTLKDSYPRLFRLESIQDCRWQRQLRSSTELMELQDLQSLLSSMSLSTDKDKWECMSDPSRCFTVKGLRNYITNSSIPLEFTPTRWNKLVPLKVNIASWRIKRLRIPTRVNLDWSIDLHSLRCPVCDEDLKTEEHVLVNCFVAKATWSEVLKWWKVPYIQINNLNDVLTLANQTNFTATNVMLFDAVVQSTL
ncbi:putative RNA-directed DNA polymerase [Tanacetum coccineum]